MIVVVQILIVVVWVLFVDYILIGGCSNYDCCCSDPDCCCLCPVC